MRVAQRQSARREGFTLLELMLVLGILVALAGISWPALRGPAANARLQDAGRQLRADWASARLDAMEQGTAFAWRYAPEGSSFTRMPYAAPTWAVAQEDRAALRSNQSPRGETTMTVVGRLPDNVTFAGPEAYEELYDGTFAEDLEQSSLDSPMLEDSASTSSGLGSMNEWSDPVMFYPDGTTSDSMVVLRDEGGRTLRIALRGITGTTALGTVQLDSEEALP